MVEGSGVGHNVTVGPDQLKHTFKGLEYARYSVRVAGYTAAGVGKFTAALQLVPDEGGQYSIKTRYYPPGDNISLKQSVITTQHVHEHDFCKELIWLCINCGRPRGEPAVIFRTVVSSICISGQNLNVYVLPLRMRECYDVISRRERGRKYHLLIT